MISVFDVVDRVRDKCPIFGGRVTHTRTLSNLAYDNIPKCLVYESESSSPGNQTYDKVAQVLYRRFTLVVMTVHPMSKTNDPGRDARTEIKTALQGWAPVTDGWPFYYYRGEPIEAVDAGATWRDTWEFAEHMRSS